jgi:hypothetical protein
MKKEFLLLRTEEPYIAVHCIEAPCGKEVVALGSLGIELATSHYTAVNVA